jgi:hypothetical protein
VREVGTDDDQRFRAAPQQVEHLGDGFRRGVADGQRDQREIVEHALQEGQMHFQRVFLGMHAVAEDDLRQVGDHGAMACAVEPDGAERCGEGRPLSGSAMPLTATRWVGPSRMTRWMLSCATVLVRIGRGGGRAGIDVAGVRHDQRFGLRLFRRWRFGQQLIDGGGERGGSPG